MPIQEGFWVMAAAHLVLATKRDFDFGRELCRLMGSDAMPKFECDPALNTRELGEAGVDALNRNLLPLPAENCFFQLSLPNYDCGLYVEGRRGASTVSVVVVVDDRSGNGVRAIGDVCFGPEEARAAVRLSSAYVSSELAEDLTEDLKNIAMLVFPLTMALRCRDVIVSDCGPSASIKRKREKRGLPPLIEYKKLTIRPELRAVYEAASADYARQSPRFHFRRGHVRALSSGAETYVSPCWVGSAASGVVSKTYEVTQ